MQCDSKGGFPCPLVGHRLFDEAVKFPRCRVGLNLTVPNLAVELGEPLPELREFLGGKALDEKFKFFDCTHVGSYFTRPNNCTPVIIRQPRSNSGSCNSIRVGNDSPVTASFDVDGQGRIRRLFQYVGLRRVDKARVVGRAMAGDGLAGFVLAPDDQRSDLVELHHVRSDAFARLRGRVMQDAVSGTGLLTQPARAGFGEHRDGQAYTFSSGAWYSCAIKYRPDPFVFNDLLP